jgi:peptidoglycan/LPS O-acetylase OafA/YrhL
MRNRDSELAIDLYRGIAALLVLLAHALTYALKAVHGADSTTYPFIDRLARASLGSGTFWVWGFFVLSGFCIHQSIARDQQRQTFSIPRYALGRITRIYPLMLIGLALAALVWWLTGGAASPGEAFPVGKLIATLFFAQQFVGDFPGYDPAWSLCNEALYYILWPMLLINCRWQVTRAAVIGAISSFVVALALVAVWKTAFAGDGQHWLVPAWCMIALFVVWLAGAALASIWQWLQPRMTPRLAWFAIVWLALIYSINVAIHYYHARAWTYTLAAYATAPAFALLIASGHHLRLSQSHFWQKLATWLGTLSYPCYLLHQPVLDFLEYAVMHRLPGSIQESPWLHTVTLAVPATLFVSVLGVTLEKRVMAWRARILGGRPSPLPSTTATIIA